MLSNNNFFYTGSWFRKNFGN